MLSDDQRKLLKLLANQDEAYEAIAAATGASVGDLKAKAAEALAELEKDDDARDEGARPAGDTSGQPRSARAGTRTAVRVPGNRRFAELIGGAVVVLLLILFATGAVDVGGDDDEGGDGSASAGLTEGLPASVAKRATQAVLRPVGESDASGRALFGRFRKQVALVLAAKGLEPSPAGQSYAVSLVNADGERIPIAATRVGSNGAIATQIGVPATVLGALASGYDEMEISLVVNRELEAALKEARGEESAPDFGGEPVLRGEVTGPVLSAGG